MKEYYVSTANFNTLVLSLLKNAKIIAPVKARLKEICAEDIGNIDLSGFRTAETFKAVIFKIAQKVAECFGNEEEMKLEPVILLGARGCDVEGIAVQDKVYCEGETCDPFYVNVREKITVIGADCTDCGKSCFCALVKGKPYPERGLDLNLSLVEGGYWVEVGSAKGEEIVAGNASLFEEIKSEMTEQRQRNRDRCLVLLDEINQDYRLKYDLSKTHKMNLENKVWRILTRDCVECSACNFACPTCTCFLLLDARNKKQDTRYKLWDACLKNGYARVAGGANSRPRLYERLQNRYHCKFDYSFDRLGRYTCVGCGRCIDGCAGNIDMRRIFVELEKQVPLTAKLI
jgi:formate hydrogenlyase subunit 6/NADH:ubiquinone oxidoreductase subunit I